MAAYPISRFYSCESRVCFSQDDISYNHYTKNRNTTTVNNTNFTFITIGELLIYSAFGISGVVLSVYLFITVISLFEGPDPHINNPPKAARYNGDGSERRFAAPPPKNLRALVRPFNRMTSQDAKEIVQNYIGEWISLSGVISDISKFEDKRIVSLNYKTRSPSATLTFNTYWTKWIKAMHKKDKIWAVCRIREIYSSSIDLDPCEVASQSPEPISAPSPAQAQNGNGSSIASPVDSGQFENPKLIFPVPDWARRTGHLFVPIMSWDALTSPYHTLTTQEADKQTKPYLEDWVIISGVVEDVRLSDVFNAEIIHLYNKDYPSFNLYFSDSWANKLPSRKGKDLLSVCSIWSLDAFVITLHNCELGRDIINPPTALPPAPGQPVLPGGM